MKQYDVAVLGAGAIGATIAWRLAQSGRSVLVLEKSRVGSEASSAAAGMLGAQLEVREPGAFYPLCLDSRDMFPELAQQLLDATGVDVHYVKNGILNLALSSEEVETLQAQQVWQTSEGGHAEWWDAAHIADAEPALAETKGALFLPEDGNVFAPNLTRALSVAIGATCTVVEGADVVDLESRDGVVHLSTSRGTFVAEQVVVATGAWAERLLRPLGYEVGIKPVKGQMLSIRPRPGIRLRHTVYCRHTYFVPKRDGTIVVGATSEPDAGYDKRVTARGMHTLLHALETYLPGLADSEVERTWAGLRPGSTSELPWIGRLPDQPNVTVAVGHFRNGILLSPVTAEMILRQFDGVEWPSHWYAFRPEAHTTVHSTV